MGLLNRKDKDQLEEKAQEEQLKKFNEISAKITKAVDSIKNLALEQDWDVNTFNVVMNLMSDVVKRKIYNTKFSSVLEEVKPEDPLMVGHASNEVHRVLQEEKLK